MDFEIKAVQGDFGALTHFAAAIFDPQLLGL